jgi:mono/diheme cytochrome c family protein
MKDSRRRPRRGMPFRNAMASRTGVDWKATIRALLVLIVLLSVFGGAIAYSVVRRGLSAHAEPSGVEAMVARAMRRWAIPQAVRNRTNPVQPTSEVLDQGLAHYADHCATCHANDGSGDTAIGLGLYPRVPDMRGATTQALTDGELFSIIEHGIRLTGMPGWGNGTPESERESWGLVHFIRRLEKLSSEDIERMESLNPKTSEQWREEEEARRFLAGEDVRPPAPTPHRHDGKR